MFSILTAEALRVIRSIAGDEAVVEATLWQFPRELERGDLATSVALGLSKKLKQNPLDIAKALAEGLKKMTGVERVDATAPGYVNVWLTPASFMEGLQEARASITPAKTRKKEAPVIVEYSQPNIAKPLGVHHILSTVIGQVLSNVRRHLGYPTVAINHLGDWGTQFGKLAVAMRRWAGGKKATELGLDGLLDLYVKFHEEAEKDVALEEEGRAAFKALEEGDKAMKAFWQEVVDVTVASLQPIYARLQVSFDEVQGESFYQDKMAPILAEGEKSGVFHPGEGGATIVEFPEEANVPPFMVQKSDGATLYATRDLATIRYRVERWHPQAIFYVVDVAQQLYFKQLFATVRQLEWKVPLLEHVIFGRMSFADKKMSTRKGNILRLEEVLDEAVKRAKDVITRHRDTIQTDDEEGLAEIMGVGAVVYGILSQNRKMDIVFDWDKMLSFEGNSAPYLQYTHARARSVLRKAKEGKVAVKDGLVPGALGSGERLLLRSLLQYPLVLEEAKETNLPHKLTNYLYQLCQDFNKFYNTEPILKAEDPARSFRLTLTGLTADILKSGAGILTLRVPDRM